MTLPISVPAAAGRTSRQAAARHASNRRAILFKLKRLWLFVVGLFFMGWVVIISWFLTLWLFCVAIETPAVRPLPGW